MPDICGVQSPSARLRGAQRGQGPSLLMHLVPRDMRWFPRGARHVELNRCTELVERVEIVVVVLDPLAAPNANPGRVTVRYCQPASRHLSHSVPSSHRSLAIHACFLDAIGAKVLRRCPVESAEEQDETQQRRTTMRETMSTPRALLAPSGLRLSGPLVGGILRLKKCFQ